MDAEEFIRLHHHDDLRRLALQMGRYPDSVRRRVLEQIAGWQAASRKLPGWAAVEGLLYPPRLALEQCSSEATARYKASVMAGLEPGVYGPGSSRPGAGCPPTTLLDLTGGLGADCAFLARLFDRVVYVERDERLCLLARHNFPLLGVGHVRVVEGDCIAFLRELASVAGPSFGPSGAGRADWAFIDPSRRRVSGERVVAISDCEPDVVALEELLLTCARRVLVKLSPMLDLTSAVTGLRRVAEAHVVSVEGECKELLLVLGQGDMDQDDVPVTCVNLSGSGSGEASLRFTRRQERLSPCPPAHGVGRYLYEPNASILKAGAFRTVARVFGLEKLHPDTHLYTSARPVDHFPGRRFLVDAVYPLSKQGLRDLRIRVPRANLTVRNFPSTTDELRRRLSLSDGGDTSLFATTLSDGKRVVIACRKG